MGRLPGLSRLRGPRVALPLLFVLPVPITVALAVTGRPAYPDDACFYGAPRASLLATDHYLALMTPLGMVALAVVAVVALPKRVAGGSSRPPWRHGPSRAWCGPTRRGPVLAYGAYVTCSVFSWRCRSS